MPTSNYCFAMNLSGLETWDDAENICRIMSQYHGGHLVTIYSTAMNSAISRYIRNHSPDNITTEIWIGLQNVDLDKGSMSKSILYVLISDGNWHLNVKMQTVWYPWPILPYVVVQIRPFGNGQMAASSIIPIGFQDSPWPSEMIVYSLNGQGSTAQNGTIHHVKQNDISYVKHPKVFLYSLFCYKSPKEK